MSQRKAAEVLGVSKKTVQNDLDSFYPENVEKVSISDRNERTHRNRKPAGSGRRRDFVERVKQLTPTVSNRAIASALGVSDQTINDDAKKLAPGSSEARRNGTRGAKKLAGGAAGGRRDATLIHQRDTGEERRLACPATPPFGELLS